MNRQLKSIAERPRVSVIRPKKIATFYPVLPPTITPHGFPQMGNVIYKKQHAITHS